MPAYQSLGKSAMGVFTAWGSIFIMVVPLTMFMTIRDKYDDPVKTAGRFGCKQKNMAEDEE